MHPGSATLVFALNVLLVAACAPASPEVELAASEIPEGWTTVTSGRADLQVALPPWLKAFDRSTGIFANEVIEGGGQGLELMAEGPRTAEPQPGGTALQDWLAARIVSPVAGPPVVSGTTLPAGRAVVIDRLDTDGTRYQWRIRAYAIETAFGTMSLVIDGPPDAWAGREDDIAQIAQRLRAGPGRPAP